MTTERMNRISGVGLLVLSLIALATIASAAIPVMLGLDTQPPPADEGTAAHIFQLSIAALLPVGLVFLATADWNRPSRALRPLMYSAGATVVAFALLFYFEHR